MKNRFCLAVLFSLLTISAGFGQESDQLLKGSEKPAIFRQGGTTAYIYDRFAIFAAPRKEETGEDVAVYARPGDVPANAAARRKHLTKLFLIPDDSSNYFSGIAGNALFIVCQTGPDGTLMIYNLGTGKSVLKTGFRSESVKISGNDQIEFEMLLKNNVLITASEAAQYPEIKKWLKSGGSAGRFRMVRINLEDFKQTYVGKSMLRAMQ